MNLTDMLSFSKQRPAAKAGWGIEFMFIPHCANLTLTPITTPRPIIPKEMATLNLNFDAWQLR